MSISLAFITYGHIVGSIFTIIFGTYVFRKSPKKIHHLVFFLMCLNLGVFWLSYALGISRAPGRFTYLMWMGTVLLIPHTFFFTHWFFSALGKTAKETPYIVFTYVVGTALGAACLFFPHLFIETMVPKLYLRSYSEPGILYFLVLAYFLFFPLVPIYKLWKARRGAIPEEQNRITYYLFAPLYGYVIGGIALFPVFDLPVDPTLSIFTVLFLVPLGYGMVSQKLMDVRIVIKKALVASVAVAGTSGILAGVSLGSALLAQKVPGFTFWTVPIGASIVAYIVGVIVWRKWQETEKLKYEFITVATHKLRTPLTVIRWGIASLEGSGDLNAAEQEAMRTIREANSRLIKLSDALLAAAQVNGTPGGKAVERCSLAHIAAVVVKDLEEYARERNVALSVTGKEAGAWVLGDRREITSAVEALVDNALLYTSAGGFVTVTIETSPTRSGIAVKDTGIGISKADLAHITEQFFRSKQAMLSHTEGTGLGLYLAKRIIDRHDGLFTVESEGEGKGSTFRFSLPAA
jgi:signal transduction histidine kinase